MASHNPNAERKITSYLKGCEGRSASLNDIIESTGVPKQNLDHLLRGLERKNVIEKLGTTASAPKWRLCQQGGGSQRFQRQRGPKGSNNSQLERQILEKLNQGPKTAIAVAHSLGQRDKKQVNPILYKLQRDKLVKHEVLEGAKPVWSLTGKMADVGPTMFRDTSQDNSAPGAYSPEKNRNPYMHQERQQHRQDHRNQSGPYPQGAHARQGQGQGWSQGQEQGHGFSNWGQPYQQGHGQVFGFSAGFPPGANFPQGQGQSYPQARGQSFPQGQGQSFPQGRGQSYPQGRGFQGRGYPQGRGISQDQRYSRDEGSPRRGRGRGRGRARLIAMETSPQRNMSQSDSGIVADVGKFDDTGPSSSPGAAGTKRVLAFSAGGGDGDQQADVPMDGERPGESPGVAGDTRSTSDTGDNSDMDDDEDFEEDFAEDYYGEFSGGFEYESRLQDMGMGGLQFPDMTYAEEEEDDDDDDDQLAEGQASLEDFVLVRMGLEPNHTITLQQLAQALGKSQEEITYILGECGDRVTSNGDTWSLTEAGKSLVKEKLEAEPGLSDMLLRPHQAWDSSYSGASAMSGSPSPIRKPLLPLPGFKSPLLPTPQRSGGGPSQKGPPPSPRQLLQNDPVFSAGTGASSSTTLSATSSSTSPPTGRGRGLMAMFSPNNSPSSTHQESGSSSLSHSPPKFSISPQRASSSSSSAAAAAASSTETYAGSANREADATLRDDIPWQPFTSPKKNGGANSQQFQSMPHAGGTSQGMSSYMSMPDTQMFQQYAEEGLTVMPLASSGSSSGGGTLPFNSLTPMELIERQMGKTGLVNPGMSLHHDPSILQYSGGPDSMGMHRSHSLPLMGESSTSTLQITSESFAALNKNPISALMEYAQSRRMQASIEVVNQRGPSHRPVFIMAAKVGSRQFTSVTCHNKKDGRKEAADVALRTLIAEGHYSTANPAPSVTIAPEDMTHFDKVAALTHQTFNSLIATIPENLAGRKVIAGLVMKRGVDDIGMVISIGTGNRCITGDKLSLEGNTVNDSHAEIITRRGFMRFLYQQLLQYEAGKPHDILEPSSGGRLRVKKTVTFHLYISTAPCGDGALFSPRDVESNTGRVCEEKRDHQPTFSSNVQGLLRTKMEGGEGTIPVETRELTVQTWDGVVRGERLRTMSCTDKICRWNVLGLQGALLSHFLEPIYLDSLTLGFLYDHGHLSRAVCCRLNREDPPLESKLPAGFILNHPWLGRVTACQPLRETQKTKAFSINWTIGDDKPEVLDGTLGHCYTAVEKQMFSRLAKRCLYDSFKQVAHHLGRNDLATAPSYRHNKMAARDFQAAKTAMMAKFQQLGCGWVKKPVEEEMFS